MSTFTLHQQVLEETRDRELSELLSAIHAEVKRRALLRATYERSVKSILNNVSKNVDQRELEAYRASSTPVLDAIKAKYAAQGDTK